MTKYRKKPIVVEAEQFRSNNQPYPEGVCAGYNFGDPGGKFWIETLEGDMYVTDGDWIITGIKGEKYPCNQVIFEMTYELVEEE